MRDKRIDTALEAWQVLARRSGYDDASFQLIARWHKKDVRRSHIILHMRDSEGTSLILKQIQRPTDMNGFQDVVRAQRIAAFSLRNQDYASVPKIMGHDSQLRAYLTEYATGQTAFDLCSSTRDRTGVLRSAGRWLSDYHSANEQERRTYQPKFMVNHLQNLVEQMKNGQRKIRGQKLFRQYVEQVAETAKNHEGCESVISSKHGDMNLRNILISDNRAWAVDFSTPSYAPVGFDIVRFLLNYSEIFADVKSIKRGRVIPKKDFDAFFQGYGLVGPNDPSVQFLLKVQLLTDWNRLPHDLLDTSATNLVRFRRIKQIAKIAFG